MVMNFEKTVEGKKTKKLKSKFEARKKIARRHLHTLMCMQTSVVYTLIIFFNMKDPWLHVVDYCML